MRVVRTMPDRRGACCLAALLTAVGILVSDPAQAAETPAARPGKACTGMLSGNLISPLPTPTLLRIHVTDSSPANVALADRFKAGLTTGGALLSDTGGVAMEFATSITGAPEAATGTGAVSPEFGLVGRLPVGGEPPALTMSISLMDIHLAQIDWVGYVTCKIRVPELSDVVYQLGVAIARSIGQTFPPRPL